MTELIKEIQTNQWPCYFISPHLDDAVLSAGSLIHTLAQSTEVTVVTVFTEAGEEKPTLSAKQFLKQSGYTSSQKLFTDRKMEDIDACQSLGVAYKHLGFIDGSFRTRKTGTLRTFIAKLIPEAKHIYPVFRLHANTGKVSHYDTDTYTQVKQSLLELLHAHPEKHSVIFAPSAFGNHIDHVLTRNACLEVFPKVLLWSDYPYICHLTPKQVETLKTGQFAFSIHGGYGAKLTAISKYKSQVQALFHNNKPIEYPEIYYTYERK